MGVYENTAEVKEALIVSQKVQEYHFPSCRRTECVIIAENAIKAIIPAKTSAKMK